MFKKLAIVASAASARYIDVEIDQGKASIRQKYGVGDDGFYRVFEEGVEFVFDKEDYFRIGRGYLNYNSETVASQDGLESLAVIKNRELDDPDFVQKNLEDAYDLQIFTNTYVGSNLDPFKVIFDTGSNWVWLFGENCTQCVDGVPYYQNHTSTSFNTSFKNNSIHYGKGSVYGIEASDRFCLNNSTEHCAEDFNFILVDNETDLDGLKSSGLIGLSPKKYENGSDLYVSKMKEVGAIDEEVFSISIGTGQDKSYITFGGYDLERFAQEGSNITWHDIRQRSPFW